MYWKLHLNQEKGVLELWNNTQVLGGRAWEEKRNTGQEILSALESLRQENSLTWNVVSELRLELDLPPHSTARRIAETFQKTYNAFVV